MRREVALFIAVISLVFLCTGISFAGEKIVHVAEKKHFKIGYECHQDKMNLKEYHTAKLTVQTLEGKPVSDAKISIEYLMPKHGGHHMPRRPVVLEHIGNGVYNVESVNFQMPGMWKIIVLIKAGGVEDKAESELMVGEKGHDMHEMKP